jgi:FG-GAP-like repeat
VAAVGEGPRRGLLVSHRHYEKLSFFAQTNADGGPPRFEPSKACASVSAVLALGDQAWPCLCDWDQDGDLDLLVGGGYGHPRILINEGSNQRMALSESRYIPSAGRPIRLTRDEILGGEHWHDMGYSYPVLTDWDGDSLADLMLPNETNRILWHRNIGTQGKPEFGPRRQLQCDGYPDSPELRALSARRAADKNSNNGCYPYEQERPFLWRTGAAFADWNGDGLVDFITHDGHTRKATLFVQYRDAEGKLRLKKDHAPTLVDGRLLDDKIVNRTSHWTESFRAADWDADGRIDLVYACAGSSGNSSIYLLRNAGTRRAPKFEAPRTLCCYGEPIKITNHGPHPWVGDLDGDGKPDLLTCVEWSVYPFYGHNAIEMNGRPEYRLSAPKSEK